MAVALALVAMAPEVARADVFTRRGANGVLEATNQPTGAEGYKLTYRSKGVVTHSPGFRVGSVTAGRYEPFIQAAAERENLDAHLIRSVMRVESAFDERAVSSAGARGLMQLMPDTAARFGVRDAFDPQQNIAGGARYLAVLLRMFRGDVDLALAAYNAGEGTVTRYRGIPPYAETRNYVRKIQGLLQASGATSAAPTGMMSFTPGGAVRTSAAPARTTVTTSKAPALYKWRDARGVTHVGEVPPAGVEYSAVRRSD